MVRKLFIDAYCSNNTDSNKTVIFFICTVMTFIYIMMTGCSGLLHKQLFISNMVYAVTLVLMVSAGATSEVTDQKWQLL